MRLPIGTKVKSVRVGRKGGFVGTVSGYAPEGAYHVTDENGDGWHRERNEITPITNPENLTPP
jgi:hypothetical protein